MKLLEKGLKLAELVEQYRAVYDSSTDKWVQMGLMTKREYLDFVNYRRVDSKASLLGEAAARAITMGDWLSSCLKDYRELANRLAQVTPEVHKWRLAIKAAASFDGFNGPSALGEVGLKTLAWELLDRLKEQPAYKALVYEEAELEAKMKPKEREGTLAAQARQAASSQARRKMEQARQEAIEQYLAQHEEVVKAGKAAEQALQRRVEKRHAAIVAQMRDLLNQPVEEE